MTFFLSVIFITTQAQFKENPQSAEKVLRERGEVYFKFVKPLNVKADALSGIISVDNIDYEGNVYAFANAKEFEKFEALNIDYTLLYNSSELAEVSMYDGSKDAYDWDAYPTYETYVEMMYQFQTDFPDLCTVESIGTTVDGRELLMAKITDNVSVNENEPEFFYTSTMHGDETVGYVLMIRLIDYLLNNYGTDDRVTAMVNNIEIFINPNANPDGTYAGGNNSVWGASRSNGNNIDLNRNYPDPEEGDHPDGNAWQPETEAFMAFADEHDFVASVNFHSGIEVVNYPWDTWAVRHADDDWMQFVSHEYADTCQENSPSGYMTSHNDGITNGYDWYTISGGRQDYMNYFQNCREITLELSNVKLLPENELDAHWDYNYRSLLNYIEQATYGFYGVVTDAETGDPINAEITIVGHDDDNNSSVYTSMPLGNYYRPIKEGTYSITYSAQCYESVTVENISVEDYASVEQNISLQSAGFSAGFNADNIHVWAGETVEFTDASCGDVVSWEWSFEGGAPATSSEQNPSVVYNDEGEYDVTLKIINGDDESTLVKENYIVVSVDYLMTTTTLNVCTGNFYDTGGADANYSDNENIVMTFYPSTSGAMMKAEFASFSTESGYDFLKIYDGENTSATLIGSYDGVSSPGIVVSSHESGALTFEFISDGSQTKEGWLAYMSCEGGSGTGIDVLSNKNLVSIFPNPVKGNRVNVVSTCNINKIELIDLSGRKIYEKKTDSKQVCIPLNNLERGMYMARIYSRYGTVVKKIQFFK